MFLGNDRASQWTLVDRSDVLWSYIIIATTRNNYRNNDVAAIWNAIILTVKRYFDGIVELYTYVSEIYDVENCTTSFTRIICISRE